jgi:hypothetical protein
MQVLRLSHNNFHASHQNMDQNLIVGAVVIVLFLAAGYYYLPQIKALLSSVGIETFKGSAGGSKGRPVTMAPGRNPAVGARDAHSEGFVAKANKHVAKAPAASANREGFADFASIGDGNMGTIPMAASQKPQGCYPREHINPVELLPSDPNSQWAQVNPTGAGDIHGKNFLSSGALIGINTIGQSLRNANLQLRAEPPCPQVQVGPWNCSTIEPDLSRRPLE